MKSRDRAFLIVILLGIGLFTAALAADVVPVNDTNVHAPRWILALVAIVFISGGGLVIAGQSSRVGNLLAALVLLSMGTIGAWVAIFGSAAEFSGGLPMLPPQVNITMARALFGLGAAISFAMAGIALGRGLRHEP